MKRKVLIALSVIALLALGFTAYYYMRPSVCLLTDDIPYVYIEKMDRPSHLTRDYRATWRTTRTLERLSRYDMVIDMTLDGVGDGDNIFRPAYDAEELFMPVLRTLDDRTLYVLYDEDDETESGIVGRLEDENIDFEPIGYEYEMDRSFYGLIEDRIREDSYLVVFNLGKAMDFLRYLDKDVILVTDYLDSAALEDGADIVASPDWDSMIRGFLSI